VRDAENSKIFFDVLGITVGHNINSQKCKQCPKKTKECYSKDVVFGTVLSFEWDLLYHEVESYNTRGDRKLECILVDESDNAMIDMISQSALLSSSACLFEFL
jgi:preprotein translocase subunit SecA